MTAAPRRLGDYEIGAVVGHGLGGPIHEARFVPGNRTVAMEWISRQSADRGHLRDRLADIGKTAAGISSPHLVRLYNVVEDDGALWLVSERDLGSPLSALRAAGPMGPQRSCAIGLDVLDGLAAAHAAGLAHGSLGPGTVTISDSGTARVTELAISNARLGSRATPEQDLAAVTALLTSLLGATPPPQPIISQLQRAPTRQRRGSFATAEGYRAALMSACDAAWGRGWRDKANPPPSTSAATTAAEVAPAPSEPPGSNPPTVRTAPIVPASQATAPAHTAPSTRAAVPADAEEFQPPPLAAARATRTAPPEPVRMRQRLPRRYVVSGIAVLVVLLIALDGIATRWQFIPLSAGPLALGTPTMRAAPISGGCNTTYTFTATGSFTGAGDMTYQWQRSDGWHSQTMTVHLTIEEDRYQLTVPWQISGSQKRSGTMTFRILSPTAASAAASVSYSC